MKKNFFPLSFFLLLVYLSSCNNSNTGTSTQNESQAVPEVKSIFDFKFEDFTLENYDPHPHIKAEVAI